MWLYLAGISVPDRGLPSGWYMVVLLLRLLGIGWLVLQTWWLVRDRMPRMISPEETDPLAGPLTDAPDAMRVRIG